MLIAISNTKRKGLTEIIYNKIVHIPRIKYIYTQSFMFLLVLRYWSTIGIEEAEEEHGNSVKMEKMFTSFS